MVAEEIIHVGKRALFGRRQIGGKGRNCIAGREGGIIEMEIPPPGTIGDDLAGNVVGNRQYELNPPLAM